MGVRHVCDDDDLWRDSEMKWTGRGTRNELTTSSAVQSTLSCVDRKNDEIKRRKADNVQYLSHWIYENVWVGGVRVQAALRASVTHAIAKQKAEATHAAAQRNSHTTGITKHLPCEILQNR